MAEEIATTVGFIDRVAATAVTVRPTKVLLTWLALPFYALGWLLGLLFVVVLFAVGAVKVGIADARAKAATSQPAVGGDTR